MKQISGDSPRVLYPAAMETVIEQVWVVPTPQVRTFLGHPPPGLWQGDVAAFIDFTEAEGRFVPRPTAEVDESLLQIIPYVLLHRAGTWFTVTRLSTQGEARLHGRMSLGIGGHLNPNDGTPPFWGGIWRELAEEVGLSAAEVGIPTPLGVILETHDAVSRVHCGVALQLEIPAERTIAIAEADKMHGGWATLAELHTATERLETWSRRLLESVLAGRPPVPDPFHTSR